MSKKEVFSWKKEIDILKKEGFTTYQISTFNLILDHLLYVNHISKFNIKIEHLIHDVKFLMLHYPNQANILKKLIEMKNNSNDNEWW